MSCEESHVGASDFLVRVSHRRKHPLGEGPLHSIAAEEVVEDRRVQWLQGLFLEVIVARLDLRALVVVAVFDQGLNQLAVFFAELLHAVVLVLQSADLRCKQESVELLLLVSLSVFLYHNC